MTDKAFKDEAGLLRLLADQALSRSAGAPLSEGNEVRLLFDAADHFPAFEAAIAGARHSVSVEMYIVANDRVGRRFVALLAERARAGVDVRLLYDWFGSWRAALSDLFLPLGAAGAQVRAFNVPRLASGLQAASRDHRKLIVVDDRSAFVTGLCLSEIWSGDASRGIDPWRDTGLEIRGPAVRDAQLAFEQSWAAAGGVDREAQVRASPPAAACGDVAVRVVATTPATANLLRMDLLVAALARRSLWLTDAYFLGTGAYRQALQNAARDGVDVRLLVPRSSDIPWLATLSRLLYRPLLAAGVRVFEWDGAMVHAKTAVADGRWARIGSTNLNLASWIGNWELDVAVENERVAQQMEQQFVADLGRATEVVLADRHRPVLAQRRQPARAAGAGQGGRSSTGAARQAVSIGSAVNAALRGTRPLDESEAGSLAVGALALIGLAIAGLLLPYLIAAPVALVSAWFGVVLLRRWLRLRRGRGDDGPSAG